MADILRDLVVSLSLDGDNFSRNPTSINNQIQKAESEFRQAAAGMDGFEKYTKGMEIRLSSLQQKAVSQHDAFYKVVHARKPDCNRKPRKA